MTVSKESGYMKDIKTITKKDHVEYDYDKQKHQGSNFIRYCLSPSYYMVIRIRRIKNLFHNNSLRKILKVRWQDHMNMVE